MASGVPPQVPGSPGLAGLRGRQILAAGAVLAAITVVVVWLAYEGTPEDGETTFGNATRQGSSDRSNAVEAESPAAAPVDALWHEVDESTVAPLPAYPEEWSELGRALVRVSAAAAAAPGWRTGDRLALPVPQLETVYLAVIQEIDDGPGPSRAAVAAVPVDDGRDRRVVVTVGPAHTFAYIDTPRGSYELTAGREFGWLLPSASMQAGFDFSKTDVIPRAADDAGSDGR